MGELAVVRGGGDIATGTIHRLLSWGYDVLVLEVAAPSAIRRTVAFSEAVYTGVQTVEGRTCRRAADLEEAFRIMAAGEAALLVDGEARCLEGLSPAVLVDAILAKRNLGTRRDMAAVTIGLGPGFTAGADVDAVVETMRGHNLGRVLFSGSAQPNTGVPGLIAGVGRERVIHAPAAGTLRPVREIGDVVTAGEPIAFLESMGGDVPVPAPISGVLRGLIRPGYAVTAGLKIADIDPRSGERENCRTISDKARAIAGGVLEAIGALRSGGAPAAGEKKCIYADWAATGGKKPAPVHRAVAAALAHPGNPGRGAHGAALDASRTVYQARAALSEMFRAGGADRVAFTGGATESLNMAINGLVRPGDRVLTTWAEHNSVLRPLYARTEPVICAPDPAAIAGALTPSTRAVVMTHGSNLTGDVYDVEAVGRLCRERGVPLIVDAAQTAGHFPISMTDWGIDVLCLAGHKGLMGPQGVGAILVRPGLELPAWKRGGTGVHSFDREQPERMPESLEAGTLNTPGIAGLLSGVRWLKELGLETVHAREMELARLLYEKLSGLPGVKLYGDFSDFARRTATLALNIGARDSAAVSDELERRFGIRTRPGAHCAPLMHRHLGTEAQGAVRISLGYYTTRGEAEAIGEAIRILAEENR